ncbi:hypothetical protein [Gorillibacterium sp. sgz5001074]|uniref:hypothetical protein n=1 Tax=Gorillibacterium sp. sgz5001074 TaxID=3446695 RepID=UPI003F67E395
MAKHRISEDSTVYHYTLLYRFTRKHPFYWTYAAAMLLWLAVDVIYWQAHGLVLFLGTGLAGLVLHAAITLLLLRFAQGTVPRTWGWAATFPFYGYLPSGYIPVSSWNRANRHRLTIGFALVALLYVWLPFPWFANAAAAHYFLLLPQLIYVSSCRRINRSGLVKLNPQDISLYKA